MAKPKKPKKKKERFVERMRRRGRETRDLGQTLLREPRAFPGKFGLILKRSFRKLWEARGGGYYACGFALTFIWLEITTLVDELSGADGVGSFLSEQLFEFLFRFSIQSIGNTVQAFLWPLLIANAWGLWGVLAVLAGYLLFSQVLKGPLTTWLFHDELPADAPQAVSESSDPGSVQPVARASERRRD